MSEKPDDKPEEDGKDRQVDNRESQNHPVDHLMVNAAVVVVQKNNELVEKRDAGDGKIEREVPAALKENQADKT